MVNKKGKVVTMGTEVSVYYEKLAITFIDERIREEVRKMADKLADELVSRYKLKQLITKEVKKKGMKDRLIIAAKLSYDK